MNKAKTYAFAAWLIASVLLGVTWAADSGGTGITVAAGGVGGALAEVITTGVTGPTWSPITGAAKPVVAGNLYKIRVPDTGRYMFTLFLTDVDELVQAYSYLNFNVTIYKISAANYAADLTSTLPVGATPITKQWLTLSSGRVILYVTSSEYYLVRIPDGVFYCISASIPDDLSPEFYILVDQA